MRTAGEQVLGGICNFQHIANGPVFMQHLSNVHTHCLEGYLVLLFKFLSFLFSKCSLLLFESSWIHFKRILETYFACSCNFAGTWDSVCWMRHLGSITLRCLAAVDCLYSAVAAMLFERRFLLSLCNVYLCSSSSQARRCHSGVSGHEGKTLSVCSAIMMFRHIVQQQWFHFHWFNKFLYQTIIICLPRPFCCTQDPAFFCSLCFVQGGAR